MEKEFIRNLDGLRELINQSKDSCNPKIVTAVIEYDKYLSSLGKTDDELVNVLREGNSSVLTELVAKTQILMEFITTELANEN